VNQALAPTTERVGGVAVDVLGEGAPVTVFAHGLGGSSSETRPLATRVHGTRVLLSFRGHGRSDALDEGWSYARLADDLQAVADATGADQACGLSLGSGVLLHLLARDPGRFARLAFVMPAVLDVVRPEGATLHVRRIGAAIDRGDVEQVTDLLLEEVPPEHRERRGVRLLLGRRAAQLCARPAPRPAAPDQRPLLDRSVLARVTAPSLVVAQREDPLHATDVAVDLAAALPSADLVVLPAAGVFWTASRRAQEALAAHLTPGPTGQTEDQGTDAPSTLPRGTSLEDL
jgi:pimeloyl-ACP methyl ester carboxylesterase